MDTTSPAQTQPPATSEDKTVAIVAYLTFIGFIAAIIIHSSKKTKLGAFHLRQLLGFILTGFALGMACLIIGIIPIINLLMILIGPVLGISFLVLWVLGLVAAINGEMKPMPVVGPLYQKWFGNTFD